jgi:hypothetical protein
MRLRPPYSKEELNMIELALYCFSFFLFGVVVGLVGTVIAAWIYTP